MAESNKMKDMPVNKLMIQMGIPMILSMALQAVYNIVDSAFVGNMRVGSEAALNALTSGISCSDAYGCSWESEQVWEPMHFLQGHLDRVIVKKLQR